MCNNTNYTIHICSQFLTSRVLQVNCSFSFTISADSTYTLAIANLWTAIVR